QFLKELNIRQIHSTPYNPTGNSISERINQNIKFILAHDANIKIGKAVELIHRRLNYTYHRTVKCTPFELIYGYHPLDPKQKPFDKDKKLKQISEKLQDQKELSVNKKHIDSTKLKPGQKVYYKSYEQGNKLSGPWQGPFPIIKYQFPQLILHGRSNKKITCNLKQVRVA
ncbi:hypothetical protein NEAUS03_1518, partial [Nematocida ausubeli]